MSPGTKWDTWAKQGNSYFIDSISDLTIIKFMGLG